MMINRIEQFWYIYLHILAEEYEVITSDLVRDERFCTRRANQLNHGVDLTKCKIRL